MSVRTLLVVALAVIFGLSAAVGVNVMVNRPAGAAAAETVPVVTAAVALARGSTINEDQVKTVNYPRAVVPEGALTKPEDAVERCVALPLLPGEPVLEAKLAPKGGGRGMAALVPRGMRAFTITTPNIASGVAGFILPGNRVDVLLTMSGERDDGTGGGSTTTLLQNLEILAVDQQIDAPAENKMDEALVRSVTLLVTPDEAAKLDLGQNKGTLHLSLRNLEDSDAAKTRPATLADLRFSQEAPRNGERAKAVLSALGKFLAERRAQAPPEAPEEAEPAPLRRVRIRTLRGLHEGQVGIELPAATGAGQ